VAGGREMTDARCLSKQLDTGDQSHRPLPLGQRD